MKELPDFEVVQLACVYPDDTIMDTIRRLNDDMANKGGWRGVGVITSMEGNTLYVIYEKILETEDDNLQGVPKQTQGG